MQQALAASFNKMYVYRFFTFVIVLLVMLSLYLVLKQITVLPLNNHSGPIKMQQSYLLDEDNQFKPAELINAQFKTGLPEISFGDKSYWHQLVISNSSPEPFALTLFYDNPMIDQIDTYLIAYNRVQHIGHHGDEIALSEVQHALPSVDIYIAPNDSIRLLVRSHTLGAPNLPMLLFKQTDFKLYSQYMFFIWGGFVSICLLMAVYNLILYQGARDVIYLQYSGYVLSVLLALGAVHGYNMMILPLDIARALSRHVIVLNYAIAIFTLLFALYYLRYNQDNNLLYKGSMALVALFVPMGLGSILLEEYQAASVFFVLQTFLYVLSIVLLGRKLKTSFHWAKYYFISWLPLFAGAAISPMMLTGNLEYSFWTRHSFLFAITFEMTFISMALADRLRSNEQEKVYSATHDQEYQLPNKSFLKYLLTRETHYQHPLSMLMVVIENYPTLIPYLPGKSARKLLIHVGSNLEREITDHFELLDIESSSSDLTHTLLVKDGVLGMLIFATPEVIQARLRPVMDQFPMTFQSNNLTFSVNCIAGVAAFEPDKDNLDTTINKGLQAVQIARDSSISLACFQGDALNYAKRKASLAAELKQAISNNDLNLYHQPQLNLHQGSIYGSEVLLRWIHPSMGFIAPDEFIAIAEETGLIKELSRWVVKRACEQQASIVRQSPQLSINISTKDACDRQFCDYLTEQVVRNQLKPESITLEVTETLGIEDNRRFKTNIARLSELGFTIAIDDFGTGFASLSYISQHPFDELKLDKSFIIDLRDSQKNQTITKATISMADSLSLQVVAEGIEEPEAVELLKGFGCNIGQGYYFAKPMPLTEYQQWLHQNQRPLTDNQVPTSAP